MLRMYYRISDKSYNKTKIPGASKEICFMNFCKAFASDIFAAVNKNLTSMRIIADNCDRKTIKMLMSTGIPVAVTQLGNAGSLKKAIDLSIEESDEDDILYFCEDDYLHLHNASFVLKEGVNIGDYVTLYDHPDKYTKMYDGGEISKVIRTKTSHWRFTKSTCMTFGCRKKVLKEDIDTWHKGISGDHPHDHQIFSELTERGRRLSVCIPGVACHTDLTFSGQAKNIMIDNWAIDLMIEELENQLDEFEDVVGNRTGWDKLVMLDALIYNKKHQK